MAKTALVADDSPLIRKMLCQLFESEDDYDTCAEAESGKEAIDLAKKCRPDLIILDMSMPVMNGREAARELKTIMPGVPIILFTQYKNVGRLIFGTDDKAERIREQWKLPQEYGSTKSPRTVWPLQLTLQGTKYYKDDDLNKTNKS